MEFSRYFPQAFAGAIDEVKPSKYPSVTVTKVVDDLHHDSKSLNTRSQEPTLLQSTILDFSVEAEYFRLSFDILDVLERYGSHINLQSMVTPPDSIARHGSIVWVGKFKFLTHVYHHVSRAKPIQLTIPAFPCKSVS